MRCNKQTYFNLNMTFQSMNKSVVQCLSLLAPVLLLSGCSSIAQYFPDKEKEYQFAREIPHLKIPEDLKHNAVKDKPVFVAQKLPASSSPVKKAAIKYLQFDGGASRLRINAPVQNAWRYVNKALGRHSIEILERNEAEQFIAVNYDPEARQVKDESIWDEFMFIFGDDPNQETELVIRLAQSSDQATDIIVTHEDDDEDSAKKAEQLLHLLRTSIHQDLSR